MCPVLPFRNVYFQELVEEHEPTHGNSLLYFVNLVYSKTVV